MLINLSNHPSSNWKEAQIKEAERAFGKVVDMAFPAVPPEGDTNLVDELVENYFNKCLKLLNDHPSENNAVHVMGEMTFSFAIVNRLMKENIVCVASTTKRNSADFNGAKISEFRFVRFRKYTRSTE